MPVTRWVFTDPTVPESWTMEINPNEGAAPAYKKNLTHKSTAAPDGQTLIFEGQQDPQSFNFSGVILSQTQYDKLVEWFKKRTLITITDDLLRTWVVYIESFEPKRKAPTKPDYPYRHDYSMSTVVISGP